MLKLTGYTPETGEMKPR